MQQRTLLANYQIQRVLGQGGMGVVYLARHTQIGKLVAIKELAPQYSRDIALRLRFKNEAALMANLNHPNIVTLHDYMETPQGVYLIMEYVQGITLDHYIREIMGAIPVEKAVYFFRQVLEGVGYAHSRGIVHRDLKPANIMLTPEGGIKILDFGIAKNLLSSERAYTQAGIKVGTIYYMSPEQVLAKELDRRSDIYSLGVVLFEMLTGENPYKKLTSEYEISHQIVHEPLPALQDYAPIPHHWQRVIDKATQKQVGARYQFVGEFIEALQMRALPEETKKEERPFVPPQDAVIYEKHQKPEKPSPTIEWQIGKPAEKVETAFSEESAIAEALREPEKIEIEEPEVLLFENSFGKLTNKCLAYAKGRDYFEAGKLDTTPLDELIHIQLKMNREIASGVFFGILLTGLLMGTFWNIWTLVLALPLVPVTTICFSPFPAISLLRQGGRKSVMRGWFWHTTEAREFVEAVQKELAVRG